MRKITRASGVVLALSLFCLQFGACTGTDTDWKIYSVAPENSRLARARFPDRPPIRLVELFSLGRPDGPDEQIFGFVRDIGLGPDGSVYVADVQFRRVAVFDSGGAFKRWIGKAGSGPGEFLAPSFIAVLDSLLAVYDERLGTVNLFDTAGVFRRSFLPPAGSVFDLEEGPSDGLLLTIFGDSVRVFHLNTGGQVLAGLVRAAMIDAQIQGPYLPDPGSVCTLPSDIVIYANPWIHELVGIHPSTGQFEWATRWKSRAIRPRVPDVAEVRPVMQRAAILGLECTSHFLLLAYFDRETGELFYDFLAPDARPLGRLKFTQGAERDFPGYAAAIRGTRLATYKTRPYSQVHLYRIQSE